MTIWNFVSSQGASSALEVLDSTSLTPTSYNGDMKPTCKQCGSPYHSKMSCKDNPVAVAKAQATKKRMQLKAASKPKKPRAAIKVKKTPKKRVISRSQLVKRLDSVFSQYMRLKDADNNGMVECYTCGAVRHWKEQQAGHFYTRGRHATRWDESNIRVQDYACNIAKSGNYIVFTKKMIAEIRKEVADELD